MVAMKTLYWVGKRYSRYGLYKYIKKCCYEIASNRNQILFIGSGGEIHSIVKLTLPGCSVITSIDLDSKRKPDFVMDVTNLGFSDNSFDYIFMLEVLEHVTEPSDAMSEIYRCLKPGGKLFMSTPFIFGIHDAPNDYYRYTKFGLKYLARKFQDIEIQERNSYIFAVCVLPVRLLMARTVFGKVMGLVFLVAITVLLPIIYLVSLLVRSDQVTTGYTATCTKKA